MIENKGKDKAFNWIINIAMFFVAAITLLPLLFVLANSFSLPEAVYRGQVLLWPKGWTFQNYAAVFANEKIIRGLLNTLFYTAVGTVIQLFLQFAVAYPLSRKDLVGRSAINVYLIITMFISGGMIPTYLVVSTLKMVDTVWAMIIPGCVSVFNIIIIRTYISTSIPYELQEAAQIDGCSPIKTLVSVVLPLCRPIVAVMTLYAIVGNWNSYFNSLLYLTDSSLWPLQRVLSEIIASKSGSSVGSGQEAAMLGEALKYSSIIAASLPLLIIYPFFQKYFETGLMMGGVKG